MSLDTFGEDVMKPLLNYSESTYVRQRQPAYRQTDALPWSDISASKLKVMRVSNLDFRIDSQMMSIHRIAIEMYWIHRLVGIKSLRRVS